MEKRFLGNSGLEVSALGLGCNNFGGMIKGLGVPEAEAIVGAALDEGITFFDTADSYGKDGGSEKVLGEMIGRLLPGGQRDRIVVATKFASPLDRTVSTRYNGSRRYIMTAVEASLRRLGTDYIDLYQYHFPDPQTPIDETLRCLEDLIRQGKVRYIGCSNLPAWQLCDAYWTATVAGSARFVSTQAEYNLLHRAPETDLFPVLQRSGMSLLPYFPLASGLLSGKYRKDAPLPDGTRMSLDYFKSGLTQDRLERIERLADFAQARDMTLLELAIAWLLARKQVGSVIAGATRPDQIRANAAAARKVISAEDLAQLEPLLG